MVLSGKHLMQCHLYVGRSLLELAWAGGLLAWLLLGLPYINDHDFIFCMVHGRKYECTGMPRKLYMCVLVLALGLVLGYLLCCVYGVLWLVFPQVLGTLGRIMKKCDKVVKGNQNIVQGVQGAPDFNSVYHSSRDLRLLLDLLAESSGVAPSIRILLLLSKRFRDNTGAGLLPVKRANNGTTAEVSFNHAATLVRIFSKIDEVKCVYTVEIRPSTAFSSCKVIRFNRGGVGRDGFLKRVLKLVIVLILAFLHERAA